MSHVRHVLDQLDATRWQQPRNSGARPPGESFAELAQAQGSVRAETVRKAPIAKKDGRIAARRKLPDGRTVSTTAEDDAEGSARQNSSRQVDVTV